MWIIVWKDNSSRAAERTILSFVIRMRALDEVPHITYSLDTGDYPEEKLYETKEALLNSL